MIYVFNKSKIFSYTIAAFTVLTLFAISTSIIPNRNVELLKVSTEIKNNTEIVNKSNIIANSF